MSGVDWYVEFKAALRRGERSQWHRLPYRYASREQAQREVDRRKASARQFRPEYRVVSEPAAVRAVVGNRVHR